MRLCSANPAAADPARAAKAIVTMATGEGFRMEPERVAIWNRWFQVAEVLESCCYGCMGMSDHIRIYGLATAGDDDRLQ